MSARSDVMKTATAALPVVAAALVASVPGGPDWLSGTATFLREFGFPAFVSMWFMWRIEKRMDKFTETTQNLLVAVTMMAKTVDGLESTQKPNEE